VADDPRDRAALLRQRAHHSRPENSLARRLDSLIKISQTVSSTLTLLNQGQAATSGQLQ
jgi:hypothetical protein